MNRVSVALALVVVTAGATFSSAPFLLTPELLGGTGGALALASSDLPLDHSKSAHGIEPADTRRNGLNGAPPDPTTVVDADRVKFLITVHANGSARWTFFYIRRLENETERNQFESFAKDFNENETEIYIDFKRGSRALAAEGTNETGRDMVATDFSKEAYLGGDCLTLDDCGTVRMSFTWSNFTKVSGDRYIVADVFSGGLYLSPDQTLVFRTGMGLVFNEVLPETFEASNPDSLSESETVTWQGEQTFSDARPRIVFVPASQQTTSGTKTDSDAEITSAHDSTRTASTISPAAGGSPLAVLAIGSLLIVVLGGGLVLLKRREAAGASRPWTGAADGEQGATGTVEGGSGSAHREEALLSDEDKVLGLLRDNGGRMKQVDIVDETDWSKSKVSMLLSEMEEAEQISKLRVGRENIVSLTGREPEAAGSPHDTEEAGE